MIIATPMDLNKLIHINKPTTKVKYVLGRLAVCESGDSLNRDRFPHVACAVVTYLEAYMAVFCCL